jgi:hypothetical protein
MDVCVRMSKTKNREQLELERDLLVSGKYRQRKERSKKHYDRAKQRDMIKEEFDYEIDNRS